MKKKGNEHNLTVLTLIMVFLSIIATSIFIATGAFDDEKNTVRKPSLTEDNALEIAHEKIKEAFNYIFTEQSAYCGTNMIWVDQIIEVDNGIYAESQDFKSVEELNNYLSNIFSNELIEQYSYDNKNADNKFLPASTTGPYVEQDGKLYCRAVSTYDVFNYDEQQTKIELKSITNSIIYLDATIVYTGVDSENKTDVSITIEKTNTNKWLITKFDFVNN